MMKKIIKQLMMMAVVLTVAFGLTETVDAAQMEDATETEEAFEEYEKTPLTFEIAIFTYEIIPEATQEDMPKGFILGDWEYNGVPVKAGFTENSDMICVMGEDVESGYQYRFIYDPTHDMFVPYFGTEIKDGYVYTIPMYEDAEVPYGFIDSYFVIQTVPMFTYMREDAELTQEEIAVGSLSEDNYLVFLMMDEKGKEVHYTYDLVDRTFQRALLQKKDAEKVTELNETIDKLSEDIGTLNAINAERMNNRLTLIGILIAVVLIMAGVIVNLLLKVARLKEQQEFVEDDTEDIADAEADDVDTEEIEDDVEEYFQDGEEEDEADLPEIMHLDSKHFSDDDFQIIDLDADDL